MPVVVNDRKFTVKGGNGFNEELQVSPDTTFESFTKRVENLMGLDDTKAVKLIAKGKTITDSTFNTIESGTFILALPRNRAPVASAESAPAESTSAEPVSAEPVPVSPSTNQDSESLYSYGQVKASIIVFLDFVRNNPQLKNLYDTNYPQLMTEIIKNKDIDTIITNIVKQSKEIIGMGFDPTVVVKTFVECGNDKQKTINILLGL